MNKSRFRVAFGAYGIETESPHPVDEPSALVDEEIHALSYGSQTARRIQSSLPYDVKAYFTVTQIYEA